MSSCQLSPKVRRRCIRTSKLKHILREETGGGASNLEGRSLLPLGSLGGDGGIGWGGEKGKGRKGREGGDGGIEEEEGRGGRRGSE